MPANIKVAVRVRPLLPHELGNGEKRDKIEINNEKKTIEWVSIRVKLDNYQSE